MRNILAREPGEPDKVFVQCCDCQQLVARYVIGQGGYYHHGKGFESYIRGLSRSGESMSAKNVKNEFETIKTKVLEKFEKVLELLKASHKAD